MFEKINGYLSGYYEPISQSESEMLARMVSSIQNGLLKSKLQQE
ncbi:MAG: hypothetical protein N4R77_04990 [Lactobacillus iners]|nr:hypothetical protein [Lactobacillus iners]